MKYSYIIKKITRQIMSVMLLSALLVSTAQAISDKSMRLVMFMTGHPDYYPLNTNALILTFEVVE